MNDNKGGVKRKLLKILNDNRGNWLTITGIRKYFNENEKGTNSIQQHLTFLRNDGFVIEKNHRSGGTWEYRLITPGELIDWENLSVIIPVSLKPCLQVNQGEQMSIM